MLCIQDNYVKILYDHINTNMVLIYNYHHTKSSEDETVHQVQPLKNVSGVWLGDLFKFVATDGLQG